MKTMRKAISVALLYACVIGKHMKPRMEGKDLQKWTEIIYIEVRNLMSNVKQSKVKIISVLNVLQAQLVYCNSKEISMSLFCFSCSWYLFVNMTREIEKRGKKHRYFTCMFQ